MDCEQFLDGYSDFRDGLLPFEDAVEFEIHLDACESCGRYDRVLRRGADLCRDLPEVEASEDFRARLQDRLHHVAEEMRGP
ncbi:MAG: zf-HC2 domain-containing protein, partial [Gemmatimonadota bacterium]|nr:zf-HC2 domain-containing protein [Gemmatimonadota bacterium]